MVPLIPHSEQNIFHQVSLSGLHSWSFWGRRCKNLVCIRDIRNISIRPTDFHAEEHKKMEELIPFPWEISLATLIVIILFVKQVSFPKSIVYPCFLNPACQVRTERRSLASSFKYSNNQARLDAFVFLKSQFNFSKEWNHSEDETFLKFTIFKTVV